MHLMLLCDVHHNLVDVDLVHEYLVERLRAIKEPHEERVGGSDARSEEGIATRHGGRLGTGRYHLTGRSLVAAG